VGIVCDGIGGHEGGEVASQMTLRSLQALLRALFLEVADPTQPLSPKVLSPAIVAEQLIEVVRVVNNQIASQNDTQGRSLRQRMGTTVVVALQLPRTITTSKGAGNAHELYLVHVGDSRAYWLTSQYCQLLTVDDDVVGREVRLGRSLYQEALQRSDATALIQAIGTRDADKLTITVQRFILEEDGLLLLCSDGLSDNRCIEQNWEPITRQVLKGKISLEEAVQNWINLANQQNGHDNTSIVLLRCEVNSSPQSFEPGMYESGVSGTAQKALPNADTLLETELTESSRALLYDDYPESEQAEVSSVPDRAVSEKSRKLPHTRIIVLGLAALMFAAGVMGMAVWRQVDPIGFQQTIQKILGVSEKQ
jgi:protein phosphatase